MSLDPSFDDLYIPCKGKIEIVHIERDILMAFIPSIGKGNNIIKNIFEDRFGENTSKGISYDALYKSVIEIGGITKIETGDGEMYIYFKNSYMDTITKYIKPQINGSSISPFSTKNLPKTQYKIPEEDIIQYKNVLNNMTDYLLVSRLAKDFLYKHDKNYKEKMRLKCLKPKEYIHCLGLWDKYLNYLRKNI